jgi:hypothetical protein
VAFIYPTNIYMGSNSYSRSAAKRAVPKTTNAFTEVAEVINKVEKTTKTAITVLDQVKPANRNIIGLVGAAGILYWLYTAKR